MTAALDPDWLLPDWDAPHVGAFATTRAGGTSAPPFDALNLGFGADDPEAVLRNRARVAAALEGARPRWLRQVHGTRVVHLRPDDADGPAPEADGSIATEPGVACVVQVADCLPVLLAAPHGVGAAHAGWRGLAAGVLERTVDALCAATGDPPASVQAWLGPCIGPDRFEVGPDVLAAFEMAPNAAPGTAFRPGAPGKWFADLPRLARDRLAVRGVTRVTGGSWCTVREPSRFFSFRRDRTTGRMAAFAWLRG